MVAGGGRRIVIDYFGHREELYPWKMSEGGR